MTTKETKNFKFVNISAEQNGILTSVTDLIFKMKRSTENSSNDCESKSESEIQSAVSERSLSTDSKSESFMENLFEYAKKMDNISPEEFESLYPEKISSMTGFINLFDLKVIDSPTNRKISFNFSFEDLQHSEFISLFPLVADLLIVKTASEAKNFRWYDSNNAIISSIKHSMTFVDREYSKGEILIFEAERITMLEEASVIEVAGSIKSASGTIISTFSQIISLKENTKLSK